MPESIVGILVAALLGWGGFTWRRAEDAVTLAIKTSNQVDKLELKIAETYLTKQDFQTYMDRLFDTLGEMKSGVQYLTERVDYHVEQQGTESTRLREENDRLRRGTQRGRIND